jgi:hypothetical protein
MVGKKKKKQPKKKSFCVFCSLKPTNVQWGDTEIVTLCNSKDSAHIVANFDTLPSARKLLFIHEIIGTKSLLGWQYVYQISKLEDWW